MLCLEYFKDHGTRAISKVTTVIKVLIALLTQFHDPPNRVSGSSNKFKESRDWFLILDRLWPSVRQNPQIPETPEPYKACGDFAQTVSWGLHW